MCVYCVCLCVKGVNMYLYVCLCFVREYVHVFVCFVRDYVCMYVFVCLDVFGERPCVCK